MQKVQFSALKLDRRVSWFVFCFCLFVPGEASTTEAHSSDFKSKFLVAAAKVCRSYVYNGQPLRQRGVDVKGCSLLTTANLKVGGEKKNQRPIKPAEISSPSLRSRDYVNKNPVRHVVNPPTPVQKYAPPMPPRPTPCELKYY